MVGFDTGRDLDGLIGCERGRSIPDGRRSGKGVSVAYCATRTGGGSGAAAGDTFAVTGGWSTAKVPTNAPAEKMRIAPITPTVHNSGRDQRAAEVTKVSPFAVARTTVIWPHVGQRTSLSAAESGTRSSRLHSDVGQRHSITNSPRLVPKARATRKMPFKDLCRELRMLRAELSRIH